MENQFNGDELACWTFYSFFFCDLEKFSNQFQAVKHDRMIRNQSTNLVRKVGRRRVTNRNYACLT